MAGLRRAGARDAAALRAHAWGGQADFRRPADSGAAWRQAGGRGCEAGDLPKAANHRDGDAACPCHAEAVAGDAGGHAAAAAGNSNSPVSNKCPNRPSCSDSKRDSHRHRRLNILERQRMPEALPTQTRRRSKRACVSSECFRLGSD